MQIPQFIIASSTIPVTVGMLIGLKNYKLKDSLRKVAWLGLFLSFVSLIAVFIEHTISPFESLPLTIIFSIIFTFIWSLAMGMLGRSLFDWVESA